MNVKELGQRIQKYGGQTLTLAIVAAVSSGVTYYECSRSYEQQLVQMTEEVKEMRKKTENATVTQRISEQMEDIAYQQKAVSDKQRERAEEQSRIADIERGKAEFERGVAQQAEVKALRAADEADRMRLMAEQQTVIAQENLLVAQEARAQADTLFYLALSRSLAQSSLRESAGRVLTPLSKLLAYASWHYSEAYGGKTYKQDMYRSLVRTSGLLENSGGILKGNVRYISVMNDGVGTRTIALTDYGELMCISGDKTKLYRTSKDDYRSVARKGKDMYVLSSDGKVKQLSLGDASDPNNISISDICNLPAGVWSNLLINDATNQLIAISDRQVAWIDLKEMKVAQTLDVEDKPSCIGMEDATLHLFTTAGTHYISTRQGELMPNDIAGIKGEVTAYYYNKKKQTMYLGMKNGLVNIIDTNYALKHSLSGHTSSVTHIQCFGPYIISGSYDKTLKYWEETAEQGMSIQFDQTLDFWPLAFDIDPKTSTMWIGTATGYIVHFCLDMPTNAEATRSRLEREFTEDEWNYYVGKSIPMVRFMKGKEGGE